MGKLERNTFENLAGTIWSIGLGLVCVPFLIRFLGAEAFGLTGFFLTLQGVCTILDLGIGATLSRELARVNAGESEAQEQRDLVYTLQAIYWIVAIAIGVVLFAGAPLIAKYWLRPHLLSIDVVRTSIRLMAISIMLQFPLVFYKCGMLGLHRNGLYNVVFAISAVLRWPVTLLVLWFSPLPQTFFIAQIVASAVATGAAAFLLWRCLPASEHVCHFRRALVARLWRFSASFSANSVATLALQQADKIILSTLLPLETFGYYTLAQRLANGVYSLIVAVDGATFPHFSAAVAREDERALARVYHRGCEVMALFVAPLAAITVLFSREILTIWTQDPIAAANTYILMALLIGGMLIHAIIQGPYYLQVAYGSWRLISITNIVLLVTMLPLCVFLANTFGGPGAALVSVLLNLGYLVTVPLVHRRFLPHELRRWAFDDFMIPVAGAFAVAGVLYLAEPPHLGSLQGFLYIAFAGIITTLSTAALAPELRRSVLGYLRRATPQPETP